MPIDSYKKREGKSKNVYKRMVYEIQTPQTNGILHNSRR